MNTTRQNENKKVPQESELVVAMVLDKSGSMQVVRDEVIDGYNRYLGELHASDRRGGSRTRLSLTLFDTHFRKVWVARPLLDVPPLDKAHYVPDGMTALYDAVAHTVIQTDQQLKQDGEDSRVLVVVLTDGEENSSKEYDAARLAALVAEYEKRGNWTFVYLGAGHDTLLEAQLEAKRMGLERQNAMRWGGDAASARASMDSLGRATLARKRAASRKTGAFFADAGQSEADYAGPGDPIAEQPAKHRLVRRPLRDALPQRR